jgi:hypothetical protein
LYHRNLINGGHSARLPKQNKVKRKTHNKEINLGTFMVIAIQNKEKVQFAIDMWSRVNCLFVSRIGTCKNDQIEIKLLF